MDRPGLLLDAELPGYEPIDEGDSLLVPSYNETKMIMITVDCLSTDAL